MSVLKNLALKYEIHADDPIEMGIQYGKSILQAISFTDQNRHSKESQPRYSRRETAIAPRKVYRNSNLPIDRGRYATYVPRPLTMELV